MVDVTHAVDNTQTQLAFRKAAVDCKPVLNKTAVIGMTPIKHILLAAINKFSSIGARPFKNELEAKDWLISE